MEKPDMLESEKVNDSGQGISKMSGSRWPVKEKLRCRRTQTY